MHCIDKLIPLQLICTKNHEFVDKAPNKHTRCSEIVHQMRNEHRAYEHKHRAYEHKHRACERNILEEDVNNGETNE